MALNSNLKCLSLLLVFLMSSGSLLAAEDRYVTSTADSGAGTLRQAVLDSQVGSKITFDTSVFDPNAQASINLSSSLPIVTIDSVTIDASNAGVTVDGGGTIISAFVFSGNASVIKGFYLKSFTDDGITINDGFVTVGGTGSGDGNVIVSMGEYAIRFKSDDAGTTVRGNYLGTNKSFEDLGNTLAGILVDGTGSLTVGGTAAGAENFICFHDGVASTGVGLVRGMATIQGNFFGTNSSNSNLANQISILADLGNSGSSQIGGTAADEENIFGFAADNHIDLNNNSGTHTIEGNFLGTNSSGDNLGSTGDALQLSASFTGTANIGGSASGAGNVIAFSGDDGISLANGNVNILGNFIGTNSNGDDLGNNDIAIIVGTGADDVVIGGTASGAGNTIGFNDRAIRVSSTKTTAGGTLIQGNYIGTDAQGRRLINANTALEILSGAGTITLGNASEVQGNVIVTAVDAIEQAAGTLELAGTVSIDGMIDINGGTFDMNSASLIVSGDIDSTGGTFTIGTNSTITLDGTNQMLTGITSFENLHYDGRNRFQNGFFALGNYTINDALIVESGAVTAPGVTVTLNSSARVQIGEGAASPAVISMDGTTFQSDNPGTTRFDFSIEPGGDLHAKQTTKFDSIADEGLIFKTGSRLGSNTTGSSGTQNFRFVTFDNIGDGGLGIDFSDLVAGDDDAFPEILREIKFNRETGSTTPSNVKADATTPRFVFHINTDDFGTVAANGEDGDIDPSNKIIWNFSADYVSLKDFQAKGNEIQTHIVLNWETIVELANAGFNLYRSDQLQGTYVKVNHDLIPPGGPGDGVEGYSYSYSDVGFNSPKPGEVFYYKLEDIDEDGTQTFHGPVCVDWDCDGMADNWELANGFDNLNAADAQEDADGDGLTNYQEFLYGFDPHNEDSDNDGVLDGDENLVPTQGDDDLGIHAGGTGLKIVAQDPFGITFDLNLEGLQVEKVSHLWAPWKSEDPYRRWAPKEFYEVSFKNLPCEYLTETGSVKVPVVRALIDVPLNRTFKAKTLIKQWGEEQILDEPLAPVPTYQHVTVSKQTKSKKRGAKFLGKNGNSEPEVQLLEIYAMNPEVYDQDQDFPETHFSAEKRSKVGEQQTVLLSIQPVSFNPVTGVLKHVKKLRFRLDYIWDPDLENETTLKYQAEYAKLNHQTPEYLNYHQVAQIRVKPPAYSDSVGRLNHLDLFKLTWEDLALAGFDVTQAQNHPGGIRIFQADSELSLQEIPEGFLFCVDTGLVDTIYTNQTVLHVAYDSQVLGKRWSAIKSEVDFDHQMTHFREHNRFESDFLGTPYLAEALRDTIMFNKSKSKNGSQKSVNFALPGLLESPNPVSLTIRLWGSYDFEPLLDQGVELTLGSEDTPFASPQWPGLSEFVVEADLASHRFAAGLNYLKYKSFSESNTKYQVLLDWLEVEYDRSLQAFDNRLLIKDHLQEGVSQFEVNGLSPESLDDVIVLDVSDVGDVRQITDLKKSADLISFNYRNRKPVDRVCYPNFLRKDTDFGPLDPNGKGDLGFGPSIYAPDLVAKLESEEKGSKPAGRYEKDFILTGREPYQGLFHQGTRLLVIDPNQARSIESDVRLMNRTSIRPKHYPQAQTFSYLIVVDQFLNEKAQLLVDHLTDQGESVELVNYQDLCKEYTYGYDTSSAIDLYVKERYRTALSPKPQYLTIIGTSNLNMKSVLSNFPQGKIPTQIYRGGIKATGASDWGFTCITLDEDGNIDPFPDMTVARIDCQTETQLENMIHKVIDYDLQVLTEKPQALLVADYDTNAFDEIFASEMDKVKPLLEGWDYQQLYRTELSAAAIKDAIVNNLNDQWIQILIYKGHGNWTVWGKDTIWNPSSLNLLSGNKLPVIIEENCLSSDWFHFPLKSLGTYWLQKENGGAIGVIGTTTRTSSTDKYLMVPLVNHLINNGYPQMGKALQRAKVEALTQNSQDLVRSIMTQCLLGVPSLKVKGSLGQINE